MKNKEKLPTSQKTETICFGLNRETDERSLAAFLQRFADPAFLQTLVPRLEEEEIASLLDFLSRLMHKHCSEKEYHRLFLKD
ncbi:MAG: hypothetical protein WC001_00665 [Desulfurivibrionaceae bacterium]